MRPRDLSLVVMHVSTRCDQACAHCSIWKGHGRGSRDLGAAERIAIIHASRALGAQAILFTGGEPLLCGHLETLARAARAASLSVQVATNGLNLSRAGAWLAEAVDEVFVSVEGPQQIHDSIRGAGMFSRLRTEVSDLLARPKRPRLIGRSVISAVNAAVLGRTVTAARSLGFDAVSFLGVDIESGAFGGDPAGRRHLRPGPMEVAALKDEIARLAADFELGRFVLEDSGKLTAIADGFLRTGSNGLAPKCNAPEWSSVVEADGAIRPCFFQPRIGRGHATSLGEARGSAEYAAALSALGPGNPTCASCVCPKWLESEAGWWPIRVGKALGRALPALHRARRTA